jgi:hypothetical protein
MFGNEITNLYRGLVIDGSYLVSVYLTKRFQRRNIYWNWPTRNKSCLLRPCLLTDRDEMRKLYMGPAIYAFYQVSVHLAKRFCTVKHHGVVEFVIKLIMISPNYIFNS